MMNINALTATSLIAAAVAGASLVIAVPAVGAAVLRFSHRAILRAIAFAIVMTVLAFGAFTVLGAGAVQIANA